MAYQLSSLGMSGRPRSGSSRTTLASRLAGVVEDRDPALGIAVVHHLDELFVYRHSSILTDEHVGFGSKAGDGQGVSLLEQPEPLPNTSSGFAFVTAPCAARHRGNEISDTFQANCAAIPTIRRLPPLGPGPRRLQPNTTRCSPWQVSQRTRERLRSRHRISGMPRTHAEQTPVIPCPVPPAGPPSQIRLLSAGCASDAWRLATRRA